MTLTEIFLCLVMGVSIFNFGLCFYIVSAAFKSNPLVQDIKEGFKKWKH